MNSLKCHNCDTELQPDSKFCPTCGKKVVAAPIKSEPKSIEYADYIKPTKSYKMPGRKQHSPDELRQLKAKTIKNKKERKNSVFVMIVALVGMITFYSIGSSKDRAYQALHNMPSPVSKNFYFPGHAFLAILLITLIYNLVLRSKIKKGLAILREAKLSKQEVELADEQQKAKIAKKYVGLDGWLAWFMLGLVVSFFYSIVNTYSYKQLLTTDGLQNYKGSISFIVGSFVVLAFMQLVSFVLILKKKKLGRWLIIATLVLLIINYAVIATMLNGIYSHAGKSVPQDTTDGLDRDVFLAIVWAFYFVFSRRVRRTLTGSLTNNTTTLVAER